MGLAKHLQPAMMILWTNDPLIKRRMLGDRLLGRFAVTKAQVAVVVSSGESKPVNESREAPFIRGRPKSTHRDDWHRPLEYWRTARRWGC